MVLPLLALTWMSAVLAMTDRRSILFQVLFAVFNSVQGFVIITVHCFLRREVRSQHWLPALRAQSPPALEQAGRLARVQCRLGLCRSLTLLRGQLPPWGPNWGRVAWGQEAGRRLGVGGLGVLLAHGGGGRGAASKLPSPGHVASIWAVAVLSSVPAKRQVQIEGTHWGGWRPPWQRTCQCCREAVLSAPKLCRMPRRPACLAVPAQLRIEPLISNSRTNLPFVSASGYTWTSRSGAS